MKKRFNSLKGMILGSTVFTMMILFLLFAVMMYAEYHTLESMSSTVEKMEVLSDYYETAGMLGNAVKGWFYSNQGEKKDQCEILVERLEIQNERVKSSLLHPRFLDQYYLTLSYIEEVEQLLEENLDEFPLSARQRYGVTVKIYDYLMEDESKLNVLLSQIVSETYREQFHSWQKQFAFILVVIVGCAVGVYFFAAGLLQRLLKPVMLLAEQAQQFAAGIVHEKNQMQDCRLAAETDILVDAFYEMEKTIHDQMQQLKNSLEVERRMHVLELQNMQMQMTLTKTKMKLIQSMINPHFLFNCLGMLSAIAYFEGAPRTRETALKIADYLRESLGLVGKNIRLREELAHTNKYLEIQKMRFEDRICFRTFLEKDCENFLVPAMILQPLVENAVSYGMKGREDGGTVEIKIFRQEGQIRIVVEDDGSGMDEEELEQVRREISEPFKPGEHTIGLHSVASRIKACYGDAAQIELFSKKGEHTSVVICLETMSLAEEPEIPFGSS